MNGLPLRVAAIITRLEGGAGVLALRGATVLDPACYRVTIITGSGNHLLDQATAAGLEVVVEPALRTPIDPRSDLWALRSLTALLRRGRYDVAHRTRRRLERSAGWRPPAPGCRGSSTPTTASRSTSSSLAFAAGPTSRSNAGSAVTPTSRCASAPAWPWRPSGGG